VNLDKATVRVKAFDWCKGNKVKQCGDILEIVNVLPSGNLMTNKRIVNQEDMVEIVSI
jgi:hypothetical protein